MANSLKKLRTAPIARDDEERRFPWLEVTLAVSALALFFQLFPNIWWWGVSLAALAFSYVDVRGWTWRSYAVVCVVVIAALIVIKGRQDSA